MVNEPPCCGARGSLVSPRVNCTRSIGRPSVSAATCVIDVQVPGPMSLVALVTSADPSGSSRAVMDVIFVDEHDPHVNPLGVKGIGELAMVGVAPAIANAVFHATGKRVRDMPITPDKLL